MQIEIVYTDILEESAGYGEIKDGVLYAFVKEEFKHDKSTTDLIVSELVRKFRLKYD